MDELKVRRDDNYCKQTHKKCYYKSYNNDIKYHMTLNTIVNILNDENKVQFLNIVK